jgi:hypothetical protein
MVMVKRSTDGQDMVTIYSILGTKIVDIERP